MKPVSTVGSGGGAGALGSGCCAAFHVTFALPSIPGPDSSTLSSPTFFAVGAPPFMLTFGGGLSKSPRVIPLFVFADAPGAVPGGCGWRARVPPVPRRARRPAPTSSSSVPPPPSPPPATGAFRLWPRRASERRPASTAFSSAPPAPSPPATGPVWLWTSRATAAFPTLRWSASTERTSRVPPGCGGALSTTVSGARSAGSASPRCSSLCSSRMCCLQRRLYSGLALVEVALQSKIGLPERHRALVGLVLVRRQVGGDGVDELGLRGAAPNAVGPFAEVDAELPEVAFDVVRDAEVDQRKSLRGAPLDLVERRVPRFEVDLRRRRRRHDVTRRLDPHADGVAGVERAVGAEVADVVVGVAGGGEALEAEHPLADDLDVRFRDGRELAPEAVERVAVEPPRAPLEPARVEEVRRADLRDVHAQGLVLPDERPRGARMVEMDVRQEQVP